MNGRLRVYLHQPATAADRKSPAVTVRTWNKSAVIKPRRLPQRSELVLRLPSGNSEAQHCLKRPKNTRKDAQIYLKTLWLEEKPVSKGTLGGSTLILQQRDIYVQSKQERNLLPAAQKRTQVRSGHRFHCQRAAIGRISHNLVRSDSRGEMK